MRLGDISRVAIIGAGTMGAGMGLCFAHAGYDVILQDIFDDQIAKALDRIEKSHKVFIEENIFSEESAKAATEKISVTGSLEEALGGVQFVLEAIPEDLKLKQAFFSKMEAFCATDTILATNTSGLSIASIASVCIRPERVAGMHWVNPPELVPLVEVIRGEKTADETVDLIFGIAEKLGKMPIIIQKEMPGFAMNRLQFAALREALHLVEAGVLTPEDADKAMSYGVGFRYPWLGPLRTADLGGLDVFHSVASYLFRDLNAMDTPPESLNRLVEDGKLGIKTGKGFYDYEKESSEEILRKRDLYFLRQWKLIRDIQQS